MREQATKRFRQVMSSQINAYALKNSGTAVSKGDEARTGAVVNDSMDMNQLSNWVDIESEAHSAAETAALAKLTPIAGLMMMVKTGIGVRTKVNSPGVATPVKADPPGWAPLPPAGSANSNAAMSTDNRSRKPKLTSGGE